MDNDKFIQLCKEKVVDYTNTFMNLNSINQPVHISTSNGMHYEVTYNGDKNEMYFDAYKHKYSEEINLDK